MWCANELMVGHLNGHLARKANLRTERGYVFEKRIRLERATFCYIFLSSIWLFKLRKDKESDLCNISAQLLVNLRKNFRKSENWIFLKGKLGSLCRVVRVAKGLNVKKEVFLELAILCIKLNLRKNKWVTHRNLSQFWRILGNSLFFHSHTETNWNSLLICLFEKPTKF
jgi:uncharacterized phage-like protein YoqJ